MNNEIGKRIKEIRKQKKITQSELAKLIGKKEVTVRKYENGSIEIPLNVLNDIAENLGTSIANLMGINPKIYSENLEKTARELNTHYQYVAGDTKDKSFTRYNFSETLNFLELNRFNKNISHYSIDTQLAIFGMLNFYFSTPLDLWYSANREMSPYELDRIFLFTSILKKCDSYLLSLYDARIVETASESPKFICREANASDIVTFSSLKRECLNSISKLLDDLMTLSLSPSKEPLFEEELKLYFGDKYFKQSSYKPDTTTD